MKRRTGKASEIVLIFDDLQDNGSDIRLINKAQGEETTINVSIDDHELKHRVQKQFPSIIADSIDLAVALHAADRLTSQDLWKPKIQVQVVLPVRHPEVLNQPLLQQQLASLLEWSTAKKWHFDFVQRNQPGRSIENDRIFSFAPDVEEVALWSGGLDALAGVYTRLKSFPERSFPLFGTGSNDNTFARQQKVFRALNPLFPNRLELCRAPIRFSKSNHQQKNKLSRARGVVFTMLGSAYSYLRGHRALHVYENGIGAINLPYRQSAVGLDHSRSVRPETLVGISHFMTELIGVDIRVRNPFLFSTKAEMCRQLAEDAQFELTSLTSSCDSPHRRWPTQCGYCSSCILRKQALCASHLEDKTKYIVPHATPPSGNACLYLHNMLDQVSTLRQQLKESDNPLHQWRSLSKRFPELDDIVDRTCDAEDLSPPEMRNKLIRMYDAYSSEWAVVESQISEQFETQRSDQQACQTSQNSIQQGSLCL